MEAFPFNQNGKLDRKALPAYPLKDTCEIQRTETDLHRAVNEKEFQEMAEKVFDENAPLMEKTFEDNSCGEIHHRRERAVFYKDLRNLPDETKERFATGFWQVLEEEDARLSAALFVMSNERSRLLLRMNKSGL